MRKLKVVVLMGGPSLEHDVSLSTGKQVVLNLNPKKYQILPIIITPNGGKWEQKTISWMKNFKPQIKRHSPDWVKTQKRKSFDLKIPACDLVFIAMHGPFGEDGTIQGLLDFLGISYTGSSVLASALGTNKVYFKHLMDHFKIPQPKWLVVNKGKKIPQAQISRLGKAWVVKPIDQGSSVGISVVRKKTHLKRALKLAFKFGPQAIIEEFISGIEVSCGILGNKKPKALPVIEICPKNNFFDYEAKYTPDKCEEIVPARISKALTKKVQDATLAVCKIIGANGYARVDMIIKNNIPYVLEVNTLPGLTPNSLLPKEAAAAEISYSQLLDKIISLALKK